MFLGQVIFGFRKYAQSMRVNALRRRAAVGVAGLPKMQYGFAIPDHASESKLRAAYYHIHSSGFFANCSTALTDLAALEKAGFVISKVDFSASMLLYKKQAFEDNYNGFFVGRFHDAALLYDADRDFSHKNAMRPYRDLPLASQHDLAMHYFSPNSRIRDLSAELRERLSVDPDQTIAVYYRGTDKITEIKLADVERYIDTVDEIEQKNGPAKTIFLQTDDASVRDAFAARFGARLRVIDELPTSNSQIGLHKSFIFEKAQFDGDQQAAYLFASMLIMAQCRHIVMTTSNVGFWTSLYRGHARGLFQFDSRAERLDPYEF